MRVEELKVFENTKLGKIRNVTMKDKEYFYANDIAKILGYAKPNNAINTHCLNPIKQDVIIDNNGKEQIVSANFITEGDIYRLVIKSKLPAALEFEKWVFDEVLPSIRKNGLYISDNITTDQLKKAKEYLTEKGIKKILLTTTEDKLQEEYKLIRSAQTNKSDFDDLALKILKKREVGQATNNLIFKIYDKKYKRIQKQLAKVKPDPSEYVEINSHGFSINYQYKTLEGNKKAKTKEYAMWVNSFPVEELPNVEHIDFKKPVNVWLRFTHKEKYDPTNFHKSLLDVACNYWGVDDNKINLMLCETAGNCKEFSEGKIFMCIKQK